MASLLRAVVDGGGSDAKKGYVYVSGLLFLKIVVRCSLPMEGKDIALHFSPSMNRLYMVSNDH